MGRVIYNLNQNPVRLTAVEVVLVRKYFEIVFYRRLGPGLSQRFYAHLFAAQPSLKNMFPNEMIHQNQKLARSIKMIVQVLPDLGRLDDHFVRLALAHRGLNLGQSDFKLFASCLILALEELIDEKMIAEARNALTKVCQEVGRRITSRTPPTRKRKVA